MSFFTTPFTLFLFLSCRGHNDSFTVKSKQPLGSLKRIVLAHVERPDEPLDVRSAKWCCEQVQVKETATGTTYVFAVNDALALNGEPRVYKLTNKKESLANMHKKLATLTYQLSVATGKSGTSAWHIFSFSLQLIFAIYLVIVVLLQMPKCTRRCSASTATLASGRWCRRPAAASIATTSRSSWSSRPTSGRSSASWSSTTTAASKRTGTWITWT